MIAPVKPRPITGCIILAAAPVDAVVEDVPDLVVPVEVVLVPVAVSLTVVALMLPVEARVVFLSDETTTTEDDDGEGTGGKFVLAGEMTEATAG